MVAPILYMVAFGWGLGRSINTGTGSYLDFLVPGILALNSMNIAPHHPDPAQGLCEKEEQIPARHPGQIFPLPCLCGGRGGPPRAV